jgi:sialic acid synthase SpsE
VFICDRVLGKTLCLASLNPKELKEMITSIRNIEKALGDGRKVPTQSETKNILIARRSIHIAKDLPEGTIINEEDLIMKRPGNGISPIFINNVIGKKTKMNLTKDHMCSFEDFV